MCAQSFRRDAVLSRGRRSTEVLKLGKKMLGRKARAKAWRLEERKQQHSAQKQREEDEEREEDERSSYCGYTESEYEEIL